MTVFRGICQGYRRVSGGLSLGVRQELSDASGEVILRRNQTDYQETIAGKIKEMPRMHENAMPLEQRDRKVLVGP